MIIEDVYAECPSYEKNLITLRQTNRDDAKELLSCYSDEMSVPFFNSDNCHGDNFYYTTIDRMRQAIDFWDISYKNRYFIRWTIILNGADKKIGTIEMFHRTAEDEFNHYGVLRIDLQSNYETKEIISEILEIADENFYDAFNVKAILTKAIPEAAERIISLEEKGYQTLGRKLLSYDDYFVKFENNQKEHSIIKGGYYGD
jgi:ribosomal-protein-alanine N-acetyltransferase